MLNLTKHIHLDPAALTAPNLCDRFTQDDLERVGAAVLEGYNADEVSRADWLRRMTAAMDLAMQVQKTKTFPWEGCSNIAFPLITIAALQFHARAYPALIPGKDLVRCQVFGEDPQGEQRARADRISTHMSFQCLEEDESWEDEHDALLLNLPIVGSAFTKSFYDSSTGINTTELVPARDLVMNYWSRSLEKCPRKTHILRKGRNWILGNVGKGIFRDVREEPWLAHPPEVTRDQAEAAQDTRTGLRPNLLPDTATPYVLLEQHVEMDLDGDGFDEPYIITVTKAEGHVLRIVSAADVPQDILRDSRGRVVEIQHVEYFAGFKFLPSPDGSIYGLGFGALVGPLNESTNSIINILTDMGVWNITAGGFLGGGAKFRGGVYQMAPLEWKRVEGGMGDLKDNILPMPVREPSMVLYNLLVLLVNYTNRISGTTDLLVGENPGQNQAAETTRIVAEMGQKIFTGIFKRVWRALKREYRIRYILNGMFLPDRVRFGEYGAFALREDYLGDPSRVRPIADPNVASESQKLQRAMAVKQSAMATPGYNIEAVERRYLKDLGVEDAEVLYPGPGKIPPPKDTKLAIEEMRQQAGAMELRQQQMEFVVEMMETRRLNNAKILELEARAHSLVVGTAGDQQDREINMMNTTIAALKTQDDALKARVETMLKMMELSNERAAIKQGGMGSQPSQPGGDGAAEAGAEEEMVVDGAVG